MFPTEEVFCEMRAAHRPVQGTPKGRLTRLERDLLAKPWQEVRPGVQVKLLPQDGELYLFAESRESRRQGTRDGPSQLKWLWKRLAHIAAMKLTGEELLMTLGTARSQAPTR